MKNEFVKLNEVDVPDLFSSFDTDTVESKKRLYNAINGAGQSLADNEGKTIQMVDVVIKKGVSTDDEGNEKEGPRVVIIDKSGTCFVSGSWGIYKSICAINDIFETLHFDDGMPIVVSKIKTKKGHTYKIDLK